MPETTARVDDAWLPQGAVSVVEGVVAEIAHIYELDPHGRDQHLSVTQTDERVSRNKKSRREALERLLSHPDETGPPIDWEVEKESFEREYLKDLP